MADYEPRSKSVQELKDFLKERGIQTGLQRKESLIKLAEAASALNLEGDDGENYETEREKRRTIETKDELGTARTVILPDVSSIDEWHKDLKALPNIETGDIMVYLMTVCCWDKSRLKSYKQDNGYKLFLQRHIDNVVIKKLEYDHFYIKCICTPETRQNDKPYTTWILMDKDATIKSGGCTCVADDGSCKHCVALLFAVQSFSERHNDRGAEVCTDRQCSWDKPRQTSHPVTVQNLSYRKSLDKKDNYVPISTQRHIPHGDIKKSLYKACKKYGSVFIHTVEPPSDEREDDELTQPLSLPDIVTQAASRGIKDEELLRFLCKMHTKEVIDFIESETKDQSDSDLWFKYRKGRITASVMGSVMNCRMDKLKQDNYIVKKINGLQNQFSTAATDYGKAMESVALNQYFDMYSKDHVKVKKSKSGLCVSQTHPFIAASPDSFISCHCCGKGLVEVKCSFTYQHNYVQDIPADNYHIYFSEGKMQLKKTSPWYVQIQTQLFCTHLSWCDFVFFTRKNFCVQRIVFDEEFFSCCLDKACKFFNKFLKD